MVHKETTHIANTHLCVYQAHTSAGISILSWHADPTPKYYTHSLLTPRQYHRVWRELRMGLLQTADFPHGARLFVCLGHVREVHANIMPAALPVTVRLALEAGLALFQLLFVQPRAETIHLSKRAVVRPIMPDEVAPH